jgi:[ribosomal protein S5]-alanine N-acetyltransferase
MFAGGIMTLPVLTTSRLILKPIVQVHADGLFDIFHLADAMQFWHTLPHQTPAETEKMIERLGSDAAWAVCDKKSRAVIGMVNFIDALVPGMGYIIHPYCWRQGYGTEAVRAALDDVFQTRGITRVELWIDKENIASQKLAYKLGFMPRCQFYQRYSHHAQPRENLVFGLRAEEWAGQRSQTSPNPPSEIALYNVTPVMQVRSVPETLAFYRDKLGFNVDYTEGYPSGFAIVSRGEWTFQRATIHLVQHPDPAAGELYIQIAAPVDRLYAEFAARNVTIIEAPISRDYGRRDFTIEDNNGWRIRFASAV